MSSHIESAIKAAEDLLELQPGWNSYNAQRIKPENVAQAIVVLKEAMADHPNAAPRVVPMNSGGVQLEWSTNHVYVEVSIADPQNVTLYAVWYGDGEVENESYEGTYTIAALKPWLDRMTQ